MRRFTRLGTAALLLFAGSAAAHDTVGPKIVRTIVPAVQKCWTPPALAAGDKPHVALKVRFKADATLDGAPEVATPANGQNAEAFTASAVRALQQCQPYAALLDHPYERWREIIVNFDPLPAQ